MSILQQKYITLGLRRDLNLADLADKTAALDSLLDNLVNDGGPGETFTSADLDALRGVQNLNLPIDKLRDIAGLTVKSTTLTVGSNGVTVETTNPVEPTIRIKDRIENVKSITGDIPGIRGGLGLLARFISSSNWNTGTQTSIGSTIFNQTSDQETEVFWAGGYFSFSGSIDRTFGDQYGGIQWTGFFAPSINDTTPEITFITTGLFMFEYDPLQNDTWTVARSIYAPQRTLDVLSTNTVTPTVIVLKSGQAKFAAIGDIISITPEIVVTAVNVFTDTITVSDNYPVVADGTIILTMKLGDTSISGVVKLPFVEVAQQIKVRITWWFPANSGTLIDKNLNLNYIGGDLAYPYLYSEKPNTTFGPFEIRKFLNEVINPYQSEVGATSANKNLYVSNPYATTYSPPSNLVDITQGGPTSVTFTVQNNSINSTVTMGAVEIGSVIVPTTTRALTNITSLVQIKNDISTTFKTIPVNLGVNATETVNFINYRGLVTWFYGNVNGTNVTIVNSGTSLSLLKTGMIVIPARTIVIASIVVGATTTINTTGNHGFVANQTIFINSALGSTAINGTRTITSITSTTAFVISVATTGTTYTANSGRLYPSWTSISSITTALGTPTSFVTNFPLQPAGSSVETILYVYANQGLYDTTKDNSCIGVFGYNVTATIPVNSSTIQLTSVAGITNGLFAQYTGSLATGTTVTNVNSGTNTITLSAPTIAEIKSPAIIVFATTSVNKEACVVPLDTAPPFLGTIDGLSTSGKGLNSAPSVDTFTVNATALTLNMPTTDVIAITADQSVTATFNRKIRINSPFFIISSISVGVTTIITTVSNHGYSNGNSIAISGANGITAINGTWTISNVTSTSFTIALNTVGQSGYTAKSGKTSTTSVYNMLGLV